MATGLENYPQIDTTDPTNFPFGAVKDNPGDDSGTPVNRLTHNDYHQFFRFLLYAVSINPNGLPESIGNSLQYINALSLYIRQTFAQETLRGTAEIATQVQTNAGTDDERFITPLKLQTRAASEILKGIAELATQAEVNAGTDDERIVTALKLATWYSAVLIPTLRDLQTGIVWNSGAFKLVTKQINIGDWNMDTTATINVTHGVTDYKKIRSVEVMIRADSDSTYLPLNHVNTSSVVQGGVNVVEPTFITLYRLTGGDMDGVGYDSTGFNRGWIIIVYEA